MDCSTPGPPVHHQLLEPAQTHVHRIDDAVQPLLPTSPLPSIFPSIKIFSSESALCIRWPQYWSFSFSISPSNEYSGLISFRIDCFDLAVHGTLKSPSLLQHHSSKALIHYIVNIRVFGEHKCSDYSKSLALYLENRWESNASKYLISTSHCVLLC